MSEMVQSDMLEKTDLNCLVRHGRQHGQADTEKDNPKLKKENEPQPGCTNTEHIW